jgi:hypothetical protein
MMGDDNTFSLSRGDLLPTAEYDAINNLVSALTFNSTADTVKSSSNDTVVFDGTSEVVIGNSARIGSPTSGTIYQVRDIFGTPDTVVFDQNFTGSVGDEYFWGGVDTLFDQTGNGNHATQTTAINMPKLLWAESDTAELDFDGDNDYLNTPLSLTNRNISVFFWASDPVTIQSSLFGANVASPFNRLVFEVKSGATFIVWVGDGASNDKFTSSSIDHSGLNNYAVTISSEGNVKAYHNANNIIDANTTKASTTFTGQISTINYRPYEGQLSSMMIYPRVLTQLEITDLQ